MAKVKRFTLLLVVILLTSNLLFAQCTDTLNKARDDFDAGHLYGIPAMLKECLEGGFSRSEKIEAYRILTITYLYIDDPIGAESSFLSLLTLDPEYRIQPTDPIELEQLNAQFITTPIISWSAKLGSNTSLISKINNNGADNTLNSFEDFKLGYGISAQGAIDIHFSKWISLVSEIELSSHAFKYSNALFDPDSLKIRRPQKSAESGFYASLPIYLKLTYPGLSYYPYVFAGYSPEYNFFEKARVSFDLQSIQDPTANNISQSPIVGPSLGISDLRKSLTHSIIVGVGIKRRIKYNYLLLEVRYKFGLSNMLNTANQFESLNADSRDYLYRYGIVDNDQRLNNITISVGYVWPQYKPRKKNEVTIQTVFQNLFNKKKKKSGEQE